MVDEHEAFMDLVAAYAMDAVDAVEEPTVEHHLDVCAGCRHDLRRHHEILALLGAASPATPPPSVWQGIDRGSTPAVVVALAGPAGPEVPPVASRAPRASLGPRSSGGRRPLLLVAAVLVVLTGFFGVAAFQERHRADQLTHELAGSPLERAAGVAATDGWHHDIPLTSADGRLHGRILVDDRGAGYFVPNGLAPLPADRAYQLWGISGDGAQARPVSLGVLGASPATTAFHAPGSDTTFAITDEPAGGSQGPTTPVLASATRA